MKKYVYHIEMSTCKGITTKGNRCKKSPLKGEEYCRYHIVRDSKVDTEEKKDCPICLENIESKYIELECSHSIHIECMKDMIKLECPMCRSDIKNDANIPPYLIRRLRKNEKRYNEERILEEREAIRNEEYIDDLPLEEVYTTVQALLNTDLPRDVLPRHINVSIDVDNYMPGMVRYSILRSVIARLLER